MNGLKWVVGAALLCSAVLAVGEEGDALAQPLQDPDRWRLEVTGWAWLIGVSGDQGTAGRVARSNATFVDVLQGADSLFDVAGRIEVGQGRWAVFYDGLRVKAGVNDIPTREGLPNVDVTFRMWMFETGILYRLGEWTPAGAGAAHPRDAAWDVFAGLRYTDVELDLEVFGPISLSRDASWTDPIVGVRLIRPFARRWHLLASADAGGLGINGRWSASARAALGYTPRHWGERTSVYFGYQALWQDASRGGFTWEVLQHGPLLGFQVAF